jgi:hypothetical protein
VIALEDTSFLLLPRIIGDGRDPVIRVERAFTQINYLE